MAPRAEGHRPSHVSQSNVPVVHVPGGPVRVLGPRLEVCRVRVADVRGVDTVTGHTISGEVALGNEAFLSVQCRRWGSRWRVGRVPWVTRAGDDTGHPPL